MVIRVWLFFILHALLMALELPGCVHMVSASERTSENAALAVSNSKSSIVQRRLVGSSQKNFIPTTCFEFVNFTCSSSSPQTPTCCQFQVIINGSPFPLGFGSCVNLLNDPFHCGNCTNDCTRQGLFSCCFGKCVDYSTDINNCGGCGTKCPSGGFYNCCLGRCINIFLDDNNCGGCGMKCSGTSSQCPTRPPPPPFSYPTNNICCLGKCIDIFNDRSNCGGCGIDLTQLSLAYTCSRGKPLII